MESLKRLYHSLNTTVDIKQLQEIYLKGFSNVRSYILANKGTEEDAKDIYQEAFICYWRNEQLGKFIATNERSTQAYILKIAKFKWLDILRKQNVNFNELEPDNISLEQGELLEIDSQENRDIEKILTAFEVLKEPCKELLFRFYYKKEKLNQIAKFFNWTDATVKNNKYRCLQKLRALVIEYFKTEKK
ncbi:MAG TPA: sigma-70 family RNA polymerase sigma factor [Edaphocola sp.]|nr:sigma-70 family RNA polymerase sigma factor [Edaphocola sp.]